MSNKKMNNNDKKSSAFSWVQDRDMQIPNATTCCTKFCRNFSPLMCYNKTEYLSEKSNKKV